jgi:hypothetical protein
VSKIRGQAPLVEPYFQILALLAHAGVEESEDRFAYAPPLDVEDEGEFVIQRHSQPRAPAARVRTVAAADAMEVVGLVMGHSQEEGLHRAMSHFRQAMNQLDHANLVLPAQSLWVVVENMTHVVLGRLYQEHGIDPKADDAKHQLAVALGFQPKIFEQLSPAVQALIDAGELTKGDLRRDTSHLTALGRYVRLELLLGNDKDCYTQLSSMSTGLEHGFMGFDEIRKRSKVADRAFTYLRRAMLREIGLRPDSPLFDERFDGAQGIWRPVLEAQGVYADSAGRSVNLSPESFNDPWPDPPQLSLVPLVAGVVDHDDGRRTVTLQINGQMHALTPTQTAQVRKTVWLSPAAADAKAYRQTSTMSVNGEVISETIEIPSEAEAQVTDDPG